MTTDGSIGNFNREDYLEAEQLVIEQLKAINKPFIVILNTTHPKTDDVAQLRNQLQDEYGVPVLTIKVYNRPISCHYNSNM